MAAESLLGSIDLTSILAILGLSGTGIGAVWGYLQRLKAIAANLKAGNWQQAAADLIDFFDSDNDEANTAPAVLKATQNVRTYTMSEAVREKIKGLIDPTEVAAVLLTIDANEAAGHAKYDIETSVGTIRIEYGEIMGVDTSTATKNTVLHQMTMATKEWVLYGHPADVQQSLRSQIAAAEADGQNHYRIFFPDGYYDIHNGFYKGDGTPNYPNTLTEYQEIPAEQ